MPDELLTRGGRKLEAAIERFGLQKTIAGARAIDVGASTGGFTAALLRHGAKHVVAVDVGRDQLHESLRSDARVERLEGVHFRTLPLDVAAGPFDFFTVDVSFVAARTMLRGLAFRLRDGAEGLVLVKPQFELADHLVRGGDVRDEGLRRQALDAVRVKAESLGFAVVESIDSPVAGGSGTVEILAHLRFAGRSARLPRPGEKKSGRAAVVAAPKTLTSALKFFAVAAPGLEAVVAAEVAALDGALDVRTVDGGVEFGGDLALAARANRRLRIASRVLCRLGEVDAERFPQLRHFIAKLPWRELFSDDTQLAVRATQTGSRLYHTGAIAETVQLGIADALGRRVALTRVSDEDEGDASRQLVLLRGDRNHFTISADTSGALLHRRGWRLDTGVAPLRETLAAGILALLEWSPSTPLWDPMCGSGTFPIEAALFAAGADPGAHRLFSVDKWPAAAGLTNVAAPRRTPPSPIAGSDARPPAIADARANAARAAVDSHITFTVAAVEQATPPPGVGLVVINPPYGHRLAGDVRTVYRTLGRRLREVARGWRLGILVPANRAQDLSQTLGIRVTQNIPLRNGGLPIRLLVAKI